MHHRQLQHHADPGIEPRLMTPVVHSAEDLACGEVPNNETSANDMIMICDNVTRQCILSLSLVAPHSSITLILSSAPTHSQTSSVQSTLSLRRSRLRADAFMDGGRLKLSHFHPTKLNSSGGVQFRAWVGGRGKETWDTHYWLHYDLQTLLQHRVERVLVGGAPTVLNFILAHVANGFLIVKNGRNSIDFPLTRWLSEG